MTPDSDSILDGITRDSILDLAADRGMKVERRRVTIDEWRAGVADGSIVEAFACGTAAVVTPIAELVSASGTLVMPESHEVAMSLREELTDIQYGRVPDRHGWLTRLDGAVEAGLGTGE